MAKFNSRINLQLLRRDNKNSLISTKSNLHETICTNSYPNPFFYEHLQASHIPNPKIIIINFDSTPNSDGSLNPATELAMDSSRCIFCHCWPLSDEIQKFCCHLVTQLMTDKQRWRTKGAKISDGIFIPSPPTTEFLSLMVTELLFHRHVNFFPFLSPPVRHYFYPFLTKFLCFATVSNYKYILFPARKYIEDNSLNINASFEALSTNLNQQRSQPSHTNQILSRVSSKFITNSYNAWKYKCT